MLRSIYHVRKNDVVQVMTGKDKGKNGKVLRVFPKKQRAIVEHINLVKKAQRKTQQNQQGGFVEIEASVHLSNLMLFHSHLTALVPSIIL